MTDCTVADNVAPNSSGGGLFARGAALTITRTTFSGNRAEQVPGLLGDGGGIFANLNPTLTLTNCTISGNGASDSGGGIAWQAAAGTLLTLENCTVANNTADAEGNGAGTGGGIHRTGGTVQIANTIIADNTDRTTLRPNISGTITSLGYNLIGSLGAQAFGANTTGDRYGDPGNTTIPNPGTVESATTITTNLGSMAFNGGFGRTHLPLAGSPALNNANPATTVPPDQRSVPRPAGAGYDIGSVEANGCVSGPFVVTTVDDNIAGSLRDALLLACADSVITFSPALTAAGPTTITFSGRHLPISRNVTILGPGRDLLAVSAGGGIPGLCTVKRDKRNDWRPDSCQRLRRFQWRID